MTKPPEHTVTLTRKPRFGGLDPLHLPTCTVCGDLSQPTDLDDAKSVKRRHEARVAGLAETADHSGPVSER